MDDIILVMPLEKAPNPARQSRKFIQSWTWRRAGEDFQPHTQEALKEYGPNQGKTFWEGPAEAQGRAPTYLPDTLNRIHQETQDYLKQKHATPDDPNPDLDKKTVQVYRGVPGHATSYTPSALESWTTDKGTAHNFGSHLSIWGSAGPPDERGITPSYGGKYTVLSAKVPMSAALMTHESHQGRGWDKSLQGKQEWTILGGGIPDTIQAEHHLARPGFEPEKIGQSQIGRTQ